jgi:8-oxo-dGTP diphosphatase
MASMPVMAEMRSAVVAVIPAMCLFARVLGSAACKWRQKRLVWMGLELVEKSVMDWSRWLPREHANLCFILKEGRVLLIRKKRGLGAGKINGPGGKLEAGETALDAAVREVREEIGVTPLGVEDRGVLRFQFADGYSLHCAVFVATDYEGELCETDEATPFWFTPAEVPYHEMWEDDQYWLPQVLAGQKFNGWFVFDGDRMLEKRLEFFA